jgi:RNA polymerase sigma factor (sigma-70 family)
MSEADRNDTPNVDSTLQRVIQIARAVASRRLTIQDAEDVAQIVAFECWQRLQAGSASITDGQPLEPFVAAMVAFRITNQKRTNSRARAESLEDWDQRLQLHNTPPDMARKIDYADAAGAVAEALEGMAPARAAAFRLVRNQGLSLKEAAKKRGVTVNTLKSQLYAADNIVGAALAKYREVSK